MASDSFHFKGIFANCCAKITVFVHRPAHVLNCRKFVPYCFPALDHPETAAAHPALSGPELVVVPSPCSPFGPLRTPFERQKWPFERPSNPPSNSAQTAFERLSTHTPHTPRGVRRRRALWAARRNGGGGRPRRCIANKKSALLKSVCLLGRLTNGFPSRSSFEKSACINSFRCHVAGMLQRSEW